jgi:hypothetical protein
MLAHMRLVPDSFTVEQLTSMVDKGEFALPEFQRLFIWRPNAVADLLRTIARRWPAGTFLLLEVDGQPDFAFRELMGAPKVTSPKILLLDGQQRTTALYQALNDKAAETYFVDLGQVLESGEFEDEHLRFMRNYTFQKAYPDVNAAAAARIIKVSDLADDAAFQRWLRHVDDSDEQDAYIAIRASELAGFKQYEIPAVKLSHDVPLAAIAKIFETLNRTGTRLATFDLMIARLYPYDFKLRDEWELARSEVSEFAQFGLDADDGVEILKLIALDEHLKQRASGVKLTVKGIRESDVLALSPGAVIQGWKSAVSGFAAALRFVRERCGVIRPGLLPASTMLHPLAHLLSRDDLREHFERDLETWFWAAAFRQAYSQGANTQGVSDARALRGWNEDPEAVPEVIRTFRVDGEVLFESRRRNEMLVRTILSRTVVLNARDWIENKRFLELGEPLEFHHVVPDDFLKKYSRAEPDPVVNYSLLTEASNKSLRNEHPRQVLRRPDVFTSAVQSNQISTSDLENPEADEEEYASEVFRKRADDLLDLIYESVGVARPKDGER